MAPAGTASQFDQAALDRRIALQGKAGPLALLHNAKVFGIACFACLGGLLYGYNQGVFSGVLTMTSFSNHMGDYVTDQTKKGWLTSILELGAWLGTLYSGFLAEIISRKYAILVNVAIFIVGVVIQCTAVTASGHNSILAGRFITGMGVGSLSMIVSVPRWIHVSSGVILTDSRCRCTMQSALLQKSEALWSDFNSSPSQLAS